MLAEEEPAVHSTKKWIADVIVQLGLCPFASRPFTQNTIRYAVTDSASDEDLLEAFFDEALLLLEASPEELATTMLIAPSYSGGIEQFYELYVALTDLLESEDEDVLHNQVQPAFFHPDWTFEGEPADSPVHFEKRAPLPVINLLRRAQLDQVVQEGLERGVVINREIAERNAARLEQAAPPREPARAPSGRGSYTPRAVHLLSPPRPPRPPQEGFQGLQALFASLGRGAQRGGGGERETAG